MDREALIRNLKQVFCNNQKEGSRKYTEAWLSYVDFGGLYFTDECYVLNVKVPELTGLKEDIHDVLVLVDTKSKDRLKYIWCVSIHHADARIRCTADDFPVFKADESC